MSSSNKRDQERRRMSAALIPDFGGGGGGDGSATNNEKENKKPISSDATQSQSSSTRTTELASTQKQASISLFGRLTGAASGRLMNPHSSESTSGSRLQHQASAEPEELPVHEKNKLQCPTSSRFTRRADSECSLGTSNAAAAAPNYTTSTRSQALHETERDRETCRKTTDQNVGSSISSSSEQIRSGTGRANSAANISTTTATTQILIGSATSTALTTTTTPKSATSEATGMMIDARQVDSISTDPLVKETPTSQQTQKQDSNIYHKMTDSGFISVDHSNKKEQQPVDEDDQVIPSWPSRSEASSLDPSEIQFRVYSLKDYSQVASPTASNSNAQTQATSSSNGKLLKSMSQDRKIRPGTKRMSDCLPTTAPIGINRRLAGGSIAHGSETAMAEYGAPGSAMFEDGSSSMSFRSNSNADASPSSVPSVSKHSTTAALGGESRIDRMRKLFVSPLSLRSSSGGAGSSSVMPSGLTAARAGKGQPSATSRASPSSQTGNPRLSFQSSASIMLNKPQHLMHVMYRTRAGAMHHRRSPMRQKQLGKSFRVYGCPLQVANNIYPITCFGRPDIYRQQSVPYVLARLCNYIEENSSKLTHEGIFRVSGNARLMEKLRTLFDHLGDAPLESESVDVATSASMLKMYLRELPEPLIPTRMNYHFIALAKKYSHLLSQDSLSVLPPECASTSKQPNRSSISVNSDSVSHRESSAVGDQAASERQRIAFLRDLTKLVRKLPIENYNLLKYLACFLYRVSLKQRYNKMCAKALGIVFGPNVFRIRSESYKGLKEQELSNQIMANIISNYRSIFDCELTDPLGNLVESDTDEPMVSKSDISSTPATSPDARMKGGASGQLTTDSRPDSSNKSNVAIKDSDSIAKEGSVKTIAPTIAASTSKISVTNESDVDTEENEDYHSDGQHDELSTSRSRVRCCAKHCRARGMSDADLCEADDDEDDDDDVEEADEDDDGDNISDDAGEADGEDEDVEDEADDEDDMDDLDVYDPDCVNDDESYSPSSESGSYCSSIDSDSLESSYDGAMLRPRRHNDDREDFDLASQSNLSSSECGSDTSYTPSSTQSDYDQRVDKDAGTSSVYSSRSSSTRLVEGEPSSRVLVGLHRANGNDSNEVIERSQQQTENQQEPCEVCKRRKSQIIDAAEAETASKFLEKSQAQIETLTKVDKEKSPEKMLGARSVVSGDNKAHVGDVELPNKQTSTFATGSKTPSHQIAATRTKRRYELPRASMKDNLSSHSIAAGRHEGFRTSHHHQSSSRQHNEHHLIRRRSSSASSLTRIKNKRNQLNAHNQHGRHLARDDIHQRSTRGQSSDKRNKLHHQELRAYGSSRRARNRSHHFARKSAHGEHSHCHRSGSTRMQSRSHYSHHHHRASFVGNQYKSSSSRHQREGDGETPLEFNEKMHNLGKDLIWDFMDPTTSQYIGEPLERYVLLRSYNSDETLLKSSNYEAEFSRLTLMQTKSKRRFSGFDFDSHRGNLMPYCQQFKEVFEDVEPEERLAPGGSRHASLRGNLVTSSKLHDQSEQQFSPTLVETSIISLLDSRTMAGFKQSELSISDAKQDDPSQIDLDPVIVQIQTIKELVKALRRLMKLGLLHGYDKLIKNEFPWTCLLSDSESMENEFYVYCVDHLSSKSLAEKVNENCDKYEEKLAEMPKNELLKQSSMTRLDTDKCNGILIDRLNQLKRRYNDLKNIRNHYIKHHSVMDEIKHTPQGLTAESTETKRSESSDISYRDLSVKEADKGLTTARVELRRDGSHSDNDLANRSSDVALKKSPGESVANEDGTDRRRSTSTVLAGGSCSNIEDESYRINLNTNKNRTRTMCKYGSLCPLKFVFNIEKQLTSKQRAGSRVIRLVDMSLDQLQAEKLELQKNLLRYEHWFGRPMTKLEFNIVGHLYERYRAVKLIIKQRKQQPVTEDSIAS